MQVATETEIDPTRTTINVIADSPTGNADRVVVVGAHLDSVIAGPGINDNGSGSSTILEIAEEMAELGIRNRQQVRFAFWGAEELNLLGSQHYVDTLSDDDLGKIFANLNFDMLGSPNYVRFVYDGDGSRHAARPARRGRPRSRPSSTSTSPARAWPASRRRSTAAPTTARSSRSASPPAACSAAPRAIKTAEQAAIYGGTAGEPYDPCYHQACDTINNLSTKALFEMGDAAAHATMTLARTRTGFFEDGSFRTGARAGIAAKRLTYSGPQAA